MNFLKKIFDHEYKELEKFKKIATEIDALDEEKAKYIKDYCKKTGVDIWQNRGY